MRRWFAFTLLFFSSFGFANQLIIEPDMGREPILTAINSTQHSLDLVMYGFTDRTLLNAILNQKKLGRTVKIILERNPYKAESQNNFTINALNAAGINWQSHNPTFQLVHQKTLIVDDKTAIVMTFNFTYSTFKNERNFALILDDAKQVKQIAAIFSADWNHVTTANQASDLIYSPDNSRKEISKLINSAKQSLRIYAQSFNDYQLNGLFAKAARRGVSIQLLTSGKMRDKQFNYLTRAGIQIHFSHTLVIHAKVMIVDNNSALLGSINFTHPSLDNNRELSVVTKDKNIVNQLSATFNNDWNISTLDKHMN